MGQRIRGEDVTVILLVNGQPKTTVSAVKSFDVEFQQDILSEGYLGEHFERKDDVFKGISGKLEYHVESVDTVDVIKAIVDRARRKTPAVQFNIKASLQWPDGTRRRLTIIDAYFSGPGLSFGSRADYGSTPLNFEASTFNLS